jgi:hypothetical protein
MNIIYYYPEEFSDLSEKGSQIRPQEILKAFIAEGHNVFIISGCSSNRKKKIKILKEKIRDGEIFHLCYGESTNQTFFLSNKNHFPVFFVDISLFRILKSNNIPSGIFYRDAYWCFNNLRPLSNFKYFVKFIFHRIEWKILTKYFSVIFLPTLSILEILPKVNSNFQTKQLPPGHNDPYLKKSSSTPTKLKILYVGGIKPPYYDISNILNNSLGGNAEVTICTRKEEWEIYKLNCPLISSNIKIVHKSGNDLAELYNSSNIFIDLRKGNTYLNMAMPIKYFEAIGYEKPIICFSGSEISNFIIKNQIGWSINSISELNVLIQQIIENEDELKKKQERLRIIKQYHTWRYRSKQIISSLLE